MQQQPGGEESEELAQFRQQWLAELQVRKAPPSTTAPASQPKSPPTAPGNRGGSSSAPAPTISLQRTSGSLSTLGSALTIYRQALEHEQDGQLDDALLLYRQAFRMDAHVDRAYHREEKLASVMEAQPGPLKAPVDDLTIEHQQSLSCKHFAHHTISTTSILATLVADFPPNLTFEPEVEGEPVHLHAVPDELLVMILRKLDPTSIERFASVNRKCRLLALESSIWRDFVTAIYKPPQVIAFESMLPVIDRCLSDYRRVFIEHPRVRLDGVYIATCHYVRQGASENSWVNISHMVTYYRYLRFYPNGQVLSLLTNEVSPKDVIPILKPSLRMKGFFIGNWQLSGTTIQLSDLIDASGRFRLPNDLSSSHHPPDPSERTRYTFSMSLELISRPLGRWNKLHIESYNSVNFDTGDICPVPLRHERPFWFSKVRSCALY